MMPKSESSLGVKRSQSSAGIDNYANEKKDKGSPPKKAKTESKMDLVGKGCYLYSVGDELEPLKAAIRSRGGILESKVTATTALVISQRPKTDAMLAMLLAKYPQAQLVTPSAII